MMIPAEGILKATIQQRGWGREQEDEWKHWPNLFRFSRPQCDDDKAFT